MQQQYAVEYNPVGIQSVKRSILEVRVKSKCRSTNQPPFTAPTQGIALRES